jgi:hypothetical protein
MNKKIIAQTIKARYTTLRTDHETIFNDVERYKAMYRCSMQPDDSYPWEYQLTDPQIFPVIRSHLARMNPAEARVKLIGQNPNREVNQQLINWELNEILITQLMYKMMYSGFIGGHGYAKTGWFFKPAQQVKDGKKKVEFKDIENRADAVFVRFNDLFIPNRNIPEISQQPYIIERVSMRFGDLLDDQEMTEKWDEKLIKRIKDKGLFTNKIDYGVDLPLEDVGKEDSLVRSQYVSFLCMRTIDGEEFWTLEEEGDELANTDTESTYWHGHYPYIDFCPFPEDDEFFSMGIPDTVEDLEIALSSTLNQLLTNARKAGNSMWLVGPSGKQDPDWIFVDRPNGVVRVKGDISDYQRMDFNTGASRELIQLRGEVKTSVENTTGISSLYASGVASSPNINKTASGARIIDNNIDQNLQLIISLFGAQVLKKMGEHFLELNPQYISEEQTFEITGKQGQYEYVVVKPEQISANFKVAASPERMLKASPAVKLASLQNTITELSNQKTVKTNMKPLYAELISETPGLEDVNTEEILIDPEAKANEVIKAFMEGYEPPKAKWDDDHKAMMAILQKHLIDMQIEGDLLLQFHDYIAELKGWIEAKNPNLVVQPQEQQLSPLDEESLMQSYQQQMDPAQSIGGNLPVPMNNNQLGVL